MHYLYRADEAYAQSALLINMINYKGVIYLLSPIQHLRTCKSYNKNHKKNFHSGQDFVFDAAAVCFSLQASSQ